MKVETVRKKFDIIRKEYGFAFCVRCLSSEHDITLSDKDMLCLFREIDRLRKALKK